MRRYFILICLFFIAFNSFSQNGDEGCYLFKIDLPMNSIRHRKQVPSYVEDSIATFLSGLNYCYFRRAPNNPRGLFRSVQFILKMADYYLVSYEVKANRANYLVVLLIFDVSQPMIAFQIASGIPKNLNSEFEFVELLNNKYRTCTEIVR
jgi:hypothetical protein